MAVSAKWLLLLSVAVLARCEDVIQIDPAIPSCVLDLAPQQVDLSVGESQEFAAKVGTCNAEESAVGKVTWQLRGDAASVTLVSPTDSTVGVSGVRAGSVRLIAQSVAVPTAVMESLVRVVD